MRGKYRTCRIEGVELPGRYRFYVLEGGPLDWRLSREAPPA
jgi:hypothetical protein